MQTDPPRPSLTRSDMTAEWAVIDNARQYISFQEPWSNDNWLSLTESNLFKRGAFAKYQMKMIPLSAWVSLSVGALLIGLEYIAAAVVTAAGNISPLLLLSSSARSTFRAAPYCQQSDVAALAPMLPYSSRVMCDKCKVSLVPTQIRGANRVS